ncbi:hypothetical protein [Actinoplanes sp. NPDC026619]|uniref:hypothetical protein n=1 Tax=Actinoplanes sp. NPDC026619 TaxID=3155798 RepID=UPI0033DF460F
MTAAALAARELRRFVVNPVLLLAAAFTAWATVTTPRAITEIDTANWYVAVFLGGFGMMATFWLTRSMRGSEPVAGVTPTTLPVRTAALCTVAVVPFLYSVLLLIGFLHFYPIGDRIYGAFSSPTQAAVLVGQFVVPSLGGSLLGVALGRWVRFPGAAFVLFLLLFGWGNLVTLPSLSHPDSTAATALRLFAPFSFFTFAGNGPDVTTWRGSPWFFLGWQLALCTIAVLVALLRDAEGRVRSRVIRALATTLALAVILLVLAVNGGFAQAVHA